MSACLGESWHCDSQGCRLERRRQSSHPHLDIDTGGASLLANPSLIAAFISSSVVTWQPRPAECLGDLIVAGLAKANPSGPIGALCVLSGIYGSPAVIVHDHHDYRQPVANHRIQFGEGENPLPPSPVTHKTCSSGRAALTPIASPKPMPMAPNEP